MLNNRIGKSAYPEGTRLLAGNNDNEMQRNLQAAGEMRQVELELRDISDQFPGILSAMFPEKDPVTGVALGAPAEQASELSKRIAGVLLAFLSEPYAGSRGAMGLENMMQTMLQASMVGPVVERLPAYTSFIPLVLMTAPSKDFHEARNGIDPLEYEDPITREEAYNYDPEGGGSQVVEISGNRTTIYPYFKQTPKHSLSFWEWAKRQIQPIVIKKRQILQELAKGWDDDLITHFDAVVPNGTLYSAHTTHIKTISNADDAVTQAVFQEAGRFIQHTESSGTVHTAVPGNALCDIKAVYDIENWGTDAWTEIETSDYVKNPWTVFNETLLVNKRVAGYNLLQTPVETSANNRKVRFFARKEQVGYFIPITVNGKRIHVSIGPTSGNDPDIAQVRNVTTPPGYTFTIQAFDGGAMQIVNPYALAKINH